MVKHTTVTYICDVCDKEIEKVSEKKSLTVEYDNQSKRSLDLCPECGNEFAVKYGIIDPTDIEMDRIPCPYCNGQGKHGSYLCPWGGTVHPNQMICPKCGHSKSHHFEGSYNKNASEEKGISECGMELQFVCGCSSLEFKKADQWNNS